MHTAVLLQKCSFIAVEQQETSECSPNSSSSDALETTAQSTLKLYFSCRKPLEGVSVISRNFQ